MKRSLAAGIGGFLAGLVVGLGYLAVQRAQPLPERGQPSSQPVAVINSPGPKVSMRMASSFSSGSVPLGSTAAATTTKLARLSAGGIDVKFIEPNTPIVPADVFGAVSRGEVEAGWSVAGYLIPNDTAFAFFSGLPFGPRTTEFIAWIYHGGGQELMNELFARMDLVPILCGSLPADGGGWFRKEINSPADLKGLKLRFNGFAGEVMRKIGAEPVPLPGGEVYNALLTGQIDGAEFSTPATDLRYGFYKIAPHYYLPGWHQPMTPLIFAVHQRVWDQLDAPSQAMIDTVCGDNIQDSIAEGESQQPAALKQLQAQGAKIHEWSPLLLAVFEKKWGEVVAAENARNPNFRKVWDSYSAFRENYAIWRRSGYIRN